MIELVWLVVAGLMVWLVLLTIAHVRLHERVERLDPYPMSGE